MLKRCILRFHQGCDRADLCREFCVEGLHLEMLSGVPSVCLSIAIVHYLVFCYWYDFGCVIFLT